MKTTVLMLDILSSLIYLPIEQNMIGKNLDEICEMMNLNLDERLYYNRKRDLVKTNNLVKPYNKNIVINYPMFKNSKNHRNKKSIELFLEMIQNDYVLSKCKLIFLHHDAEKFYDTYAVINKKSSLYAMCVYSEINDEYIYVIRGTHDDSGWLDNAKTISKDLTKVEKECFRIFYKFYNEICKNTLKKIILTGHSKGGAMALVTAKMMHSIKKHKNIYVHSFYGPFINYKKYETLGKNDINLFLEMIIGIEVHVGDITGNLFLSKEILEIYKDKVVFVGSFNDNGAELAKNHEPLRRFIDDNVLISNENYDYKKYPYKSNYNLNFSKIIFRISNIIMEEDSLVVYPLIVALMKYYGFISDRNNIFYNDDKKMLQDYLEQFQNENISYDVFFSFNKIAENKKQLYMVYLFLQKMINDDELNLLIFNFFDDEKTLTEIFKDEIVANIVKKIMCTFLQIKNEIQNNKDEKSSVFWLIEYKDFNKDTMLEMYFKSIITIFAYDGLKEIHEAKSFLNSMKKIRLNFGKNHFLYMILELRALCICNNKDIKCKKVNRITNKRMNNKMQQIFEKLGKSLSQNMIKCVFVNH